MNHFLLHLLAENVATELRGRRIGEVRLLPPVAAIEFAGSDRPRYGVVILSSPGPFFYVDSANPIAALGMEVLKRVRGLAVSRVEVPAEDRVIRFVLTGPREESALGVWLFGSAAKIRVEGRETIIEALDPRENGRSLPRRATGGGPTLAGAGDADLEACAATPGVPERMIGGLTRELIDAFRERGGSLDTVSLLRFRDGLLRGAEPFLLATRRRAGSVCPMPPVLPAAMDPVAVAYGPFTAVVPACEAAGRTMLLSLRDTITERWAAPLKKHLSARRRLLSALESERREAEASTSLRHEADILASYRNRIPPGAAEVTLPDLYGSGDLTIPLDPASPVQEQINKRFRLAAKLERKRAVIGRRIGAVEEEIAHLERELAAASEQPDLRGAIAQIDGAKRRAGFDVVTTRSRRPKPQQREFRRFDVDPQWFVLVGRSDRENDEITFRIAGPEDVWLHAQHAAGSHVVLKSRGTRSNPSRAALEAAAGIAAHYSKARRAGVVPVIYTRRKYVRKFKGAKPGQVICEREKTIFVEPRLPDPGAEENPEA